MKTAFTMIELVFIIVVLGILAAVAVPKMGPIVQDAKVSSARSTIASIRAAIASERQRNMLKGSAMYPQLLDDATAGGSELFDGNDTVAILGYPVYAKQTGGGWWKESNNDENPIKYRFYYSATRSVLFEYNKQTGRFDCDHSNPDCRELTE